jgi:glutamate:GABA antiporter
LTTFWIALGVFEAIFPDVLEKLFGVEYGFKGSWGVPRSTFEALTLGTLAVITIVGIAGYIAGARVRSEIAEVAVADPAV